MPGSIAEIGADIILGSYDDRYQAVLDAVCRQYEQTISNDLELFENVKFVGKFDKLSQTPLAATSAIARFYKYSINESKHARLVIGIKLMNVNLTSSGSTAYTALVNINFAPEDKINDVVINTQNNIDLNTAGYNNYNKLGVSSKTIPIYTKLEDGSVRINIPRIRMPIIYNTEKQLLVCAYAPKLETDDFNYNDSLTMAKAYNNNGDCALLFKCCSGNSWVGTEDTADTSAYEFVDINKKPGRTNTAFMLKRAIRELSIGVGLVEDMYTFMTNPEVYSNQIIQIGEDKYICVSKSQQLFIKIS